MTFNEESEENQEVELIHTKQGKMDTSAIGVRGCMDNRKQVLWNKTFAGSGHAEKRQCLL